ncbi:hypothetical protein AB4876_02545 [Zhongshania guokunii]|uniref:Uncharacterized protein n=1 Tax=Zhongshania guokunii TaxID=641783 RepID=A0ABV3U2R0_9GAMM
MKKLLNIPLLSLLILIYFSKSVLAAVPMLGMTHAANYAPMTSAASHCVSESHSEHNSEHNSSQHHSSHSSHAENTTDISLHSASHDSTSNSVHCDAKCQCCIGSCGTVALLAANLAKQTIKPHFSIAEFDLQLLPQHPSSLFKPPIFS